MSLEKDMARNLHELNGANTRQVENGNDETSSSDLGTLLRRVAEASTHEVEVLIDELHRLGKNGIKSDIDRYVELSQGISASTAMQ
jgi:hypothetical protein